MACQLIIDCNSNTQTLNIERGETGGGQVVGRWWAGGDDEGGGDES